MGPNRIARREWLLGTSASLLALGGSTSAAAGFGLPDEPCAQSSSGFGARRTRIVCAG